MIKFIGYVIKYKTNMMKISRLEQEVETLKDESLFYERKATEKNNALRQINNIITEYEKNGPIHSTIYNQIKLWKHVDFSYILFYPLIKSIIMIPIQERK